jgi:adenylyltransferase/sulfurtransferase
MAIKGVITARDLYKKVQQGDSPVILDVRTKSEFDEARIAGSLLMPLGELKPDVFMRDVGSQEVYVVCLHGMRADRAIERFEKAGYQNCSRLIGGLQAWIDEGLPVEQG